MRTLSRRRLLAAFAVTLCALAAAALLALQSSDGRETSNFGGADGPEPSITVTSRHPPAKRNETHRKAAVSPRSISSARTVAERVLRLIARRQPGVPPARSLARLTTGRFFRELRSDPGIARPVPEPRQAKRQAVRVEGIQTESITRMQAVLLGVVEVRGVDDRRTGSTLLFTVRLLRTGRRWRADEVRL